MKWWQWALIVAYHVVLIVVIGTTIKGTPLF